MTICVAAPIVQAPGNSRRRGYFGWFQFSNRSFLFSKTRAATCVIVWPSMNKTCLIGESDPFIAQLLRRFSEESGLNPVQARVGQDLLKLAREQPPDLIVLEPELPGRMRGWEAIEAMRTEPGLAGTPVVTCSWLQAADAAVLIGTAHGHLQKPELHYQDFLAVLRAIDIEAGPRSSSKE